MRKEELKGLFTVFDNAYEVHITHSRFLRIHIEEKLRPAIKAKAKLSLPIDTINVKAAVLNVH